MSEHRRERWEHLAEWPLTAAAVAFVAAYAWPILDRELAVGWTRLCGAVTTGTWVLFAVDYVARSLLSERRGAFVRDNVVDLLVVALPLLRPLRLLRLVTLLSVVNRYAGRTLRGRVAVYVAGSIGLVLLVAALAVLDAEQDADDANITNFADALWWAMTTVTTVGYGDRFPVTITGRFVAGALMLAGIALLGVVTAWLASWLIERVTLVEEESQAATRRDVLTLTAEVQALRAELQEARAGSPNRSVTAGRATPKDP